MPGDSSLLFSLRRLSRRCLLPVRPSCCWRLGCSPAMMTEGGGCLAGMCLLAYELAAMLLPAALAFCRLRRRLGPEQPCPVLPVLVFAAYAAAVLHLTGAGTLGDGLIYQMQFGGEQVNLLRSRGRSMLSHTCRTSCSLCRSVCCCPGFGPALRRPKPVLFAGFGLSLVIELSQLLNNRRTDIDDLILNTLGAALDMPCGV